MDALKIIRTIVPLAGALLLVAGGCEPRDRDVWEVDPPLAFDTAAVVIETADGQVRIRAEIAESHDQRAYGLMERPSLPAEQGMLFTYTSPQPPGSGFWMFRTLIPLDIAFIDGDGRIVAIMEMQPCESTNPRLCPIYGPGLEYEAALEVNRGAFGQWGVRVGDRVHLEGDGG